MQPVVEPVKTLSRDEIKALAKDKAEAQIKKLIDNQILIKDKADYVFKFTFDKGHLSINDKPFSPDMLDQ